MIDSAPSFAPQNVGAGQSPPTAHDNDRSWRYAYDGLNRLVGADYGQLETDNSEIVDEYANRTT
jgi:hypothetical protein